MTTDIIIQWRSGSGWVDFDLGDILHYPVSHACHLFSKSIPVVAREGNRYVVSTKKLLEDYRKNGKDVRLFSDVLADADRAGRRFGSCGFFGRLI